MTAETEANQGHALPREIAPGVHWLGDCLVTPIMEGRYLHSYLSTYLVAGSSGSVLVDAGHAKDLGRIVRQIETLVERGVPRPTHLFLTHPEVPHAGPIGQLMAHFPDAVCCGDVSDLHLVVPRYEERLRPLAVGDSLDLGDVEFRVVPAVFRDYVTTLWGFDATRRVLFTGDGFSYAHYHEAGQCGLLAEEVPALEVPEMTAAFTEAAFYWSRFTDMEPFIARLDEMVFQELRAAVVAPAHGLPIGDPATTFASIRAGLRYREEAAP